MDAEVTLFSKPEEQIAWADTFDILLNPSIEDAAIMLNYMEGHDYAIGIDSDGKMYRQDVAAQAISSSGFENNVTSASIASLHLLIRV